MSADLEAEKEGWRYTIAQQASQIVRLRLEAVKLRVTLVECANVLEEHSEADDGVPNWCMKLRTLIRKAMGEEP